MSDGSRERLIGRVAARLHAADLGEPLSSERSHSHWLCLNKELRAYWVRLATEIVDHREEDGSWAVLHAHPGRVREMTRAPLLKSTSDDPTYGNECR